MRSGGLALITHEPQPDPPPGVSAGLVMSWESPATFDRVVRLVDDGVLTVRVGARYPLADVTRAHNYLRTRRGRGTVLLETWASGPHRPRDKVGPVTEKITKIALAIVVDSGTGAAVARRFDTGGCQVALTARSRGVLDDSPKLRNAILDCCDVTDRLVVARSLAPAIHGLEKWANVN